MNEEVKNYGRNSEITVKKKKKKSIFRGEILLSNKGLNLKFCGLT